MPYTIIRDTREKKGHGWNFRKSEYCHGQIITKLETGDYSLAGLEDIFTIERKASATEMAQNVSEGRFMNELHRLEDIRFSFIICEFTMDDLIKFPRGSGIPKHKWKYLKMKGPLLLKKVLELIRDFNVKFLFAGDHGQEVANSLFKRIQEKVDAENKNTRAKRKQQET
jgi:hypothetical protein